MSVPTNCKPITLFPLMKGKLCIHLVGFISQISTIGCTVCMLETSRVINCGEGGKCFSHTEDVKIHRSLPLLVAIYSQ